MAVLHGARVVRRGVGKEPRERKRASRTRRRLVDVSRWALPALLRRGLSRREGFAACGHHVGRASLGELDLELRDLGAQRRPREARVEVHHVAGVRRVGDHFEYVGTRAILPRERDERAAQVVAAPSTDPERVEIGVEQLVHLVGGPEILVLDPIVRVVVRVAVRVIPVDRARHDVIVEPRCATVESAPARFPPLLEQLLQRRVNRDQAWHLGLGAVLVVRARDHQLLERLRLAQVVVPANARGLAVAGASKPFDRVDDAAIRWNDRLRDEPHQLVTLVERGGPPRRVLVHVLGEDVGRKRDRVRLDHLVDDGSVEHPTKQAVDVPDRARRHLALRIALAHPPLVQMGVLERLDEVSNVPGPHLAHLQVTERRKDVVPQATDLVRNGLDVVARLDPSLAVLTDRDGQRPRQRRQRERRQRLRSRLDQRGRHLEQRRRNNRRSGLSLRIGARSVRRLGLAIQLCRHRICGGFLAHLVAAWTAHPDAALVLIRDPQRFPSGIHATHLRFPSSRAVARALGCSARRCDARTQSARAWRVVRAKGTHPRTERSDETSPGFAAPFARGAGSAARAWAFACVSCITFCITSPESARPRPAQRGAPLVARSPRRWGRSERPP